MFRVIERKGSGSIQQRVFDPMLKAESDTGAAAVRRSAEVNRHNYKFRYLGLDPSGAAYVFAAEPITASRYLFRGKVWIDCEDYGVRKVEGEPAQQPSFWVRKTHFVHQYEKFGRFWFPVSNRTEVELRLLGRSRFGIDYFQHQWEERRETAADGRPELADPAADARAELEVMP
jgi:hypothetical protein